MMMGTGHYSILLGRDDFGNLPTGGRDRWRPPSPGSSRHLHRKSNLRTNVYNELCRRGSMSTKFYWLIRVGCMDREATPGEDPLSASDVVETSVATDESPEAATRWKLPTSLRALRQRNYRLYFFGQLVSMTGSWMQSTALAWVIFQMTDENRWPAHISTAQILPTFLLGAWGGSLADRWPKRELIFVTQAAALVQALLLFALVGAGVHEPWMLVAVTGLGGLIQAVDFPARLAFVLDLTSREDLMNAVALNSAVFNVARVIGPALGGLTLFLVGPEACFLLNAASYLAVLWALYQMRIDPKNSKPIHSSGWRSLVGGLSYLANHREMAWLLVLVATTCMCGWPFLALMPAMAKHRFAMAEQAYSFLLSATGFGALLGAVIVAVYGTMERRQLFMRGGVFLVTVSLLGLAIAGNVPAAIFWAGLCGCGLILFLATCQSILQLSSGEHNRGQIMGIYAVIISGAVPLGNQIVGHVADYTGLTNVLLGQGLICGAAAGFVLIMVWMGRKPAT
jgi:MFS family permease